ncbi:MAG: acyl-[ACP]--phospholipid O-acyltransferase [Alphaproteobacteria bacterium]|nr:acyl-[ACP]--phospholipid O-acyltransferase [Alphaproteobacteria bacterium]
MKIFIKNQAFWAFFGTQFLGAFNDNFFRTLFVTLVTYHLAIYTETESALFVSAAFGLFMLPSFAFSPLAGQLADRYDKSRIIQGVKLSEVFIVGLSAYGFIHTNPYFLLGSIFFMGMHSTFFGPVKYSILPDILPPEKILSGNGYVEAGTFLAIMLGNFCGALMVHLEISPFILSFQLLMVALLGLLFSLLVPKIRRMAPHLKIQFSWSAEVKKLSRYARKEDRVFRAIIGISWFWLVGTVLLSQLPSFANDVIRVQENVFIFLLLLFTIGLGMGSIFCSWFFKNEITTKYVPLFAFLLVPLLFDIASFDSPLSLKPVSLIEFLTSFSGVRLMVDIVALSFLGGLFTVPLYAFIQTTVPPKQRSQIISYCNIINAGFMVFASFTSFCLLSLGVSIPALIFLTALGQGIITLYLVRILPEPVLRDVLYWLLRCVFRFEVRGLENYKKAGKRVILIANHMSYLDALFIAVALPEKPIFAINLFTAKKWWVRPFLALAKVLPIDPHYPYALREVIEEAKKGHKVLIFPEGRLTLTGSLMKIYEGPGMIAEKAAASLLPLHIEGTQYTFFSVLQGRVPRKFFPKVTLTIFPAETLSIDSALMGRARRRALSEQLYTIMVTMMFATSSLNKTLFSALLESRKLYGAWTPILEDVSYKALTYGSLFLRIFILSRVLARKTAGKEAVGLLLPNVHGLVISFWALQAINRVPALLNYSTGMSALLIACQVAEIKNVITSRQFIEKGRLQEAIELLKRHSIHIHYLEDEVKKVHLMDKVCGFYGMVFPQKAYKNPPNPSEGCVILFTSGSEGIPKGVVLSHLALQANCCQLASVVDFNCNDTVLNVLPLFHAFGLTAGMLLPLLFGIRTFHYISPLHYRAVAELVYDRGATILFGTDTFLNGYGRVAHVYDFHTLRYVFAGAEKLKEETQRLWFDKFGLRLFEGYGATETGPVLCVNTPLHYKAGTVGRFLPGISQRLETVEGFSEGRHLWVQGPNVMKGYLLAAAPGKLVPPVEGWYDTGDIVDIDTEGYVRLLGRAKRFAKVGGEMIFLTAIEEAVSCLWPGYNHAVIARPDPKRGEKLILFTTYLLADRAALLSYWRAQGLSELSLIRSIHILPSLPLLGSGKVDYRALEGEGIGDT